MPDLSVLDPKLADDKLNFLQHLAGGVRPLTAALAVGWSPHKLRQVMKDPEFQELVDMAGEISIEAMEQKVYELGLRGNLSAATLFLYSHASHRGWRPPTQRVAVESSKTVKVEIVEGAKAAAIALMERHGVKALQRGGALDAIEASSSDG